MSEEASGQTIEVLSPWNSQPVKIRPQDVGRAVKDRDGKLFYVLAKADGTGYYSAPTRAGGARDEERYEREKDRMSGAKREVQEQALQTVTRRRGGKGKLILVVLILAAVAWLFFLGPLKGMNPLLKQ